jgi:hypothetical protein
MKIAMRFEIAFVVLSIDSEKLDKNYVVIIMEISADKFNVRDPAVYWGSIDSSVHPPTMRDIQNGIDHLMSKRCEHNKTDQVDLLNFGSQFCHAFVATKKVMDMAVLGLSQKLLLLAAAVVILCLTICANPSFATVAPTISPSNATVSATTICTMSAEAGAQIRYTTDGSTPTASSTLYSSGFNVSTSTVVKAIAIKNSVNSTVTTSYIQVDAFTANVTRTDMVLWLKADYGIATSGTSVTDWFDMSNQDNAATQTTGADQPTLVTNAVNGMPAVSFDGASDSMQLPSGFSNFAAGASIFVVYKPTAVTADARIIEFGNRTTPAPGSPRDMIYVSEPNNTDLKFTAYNATTSSSLTATSAVTLNSYQLSEVVHSGAGSATIYTTGVQSAQGSVSNINTTTRTNNFVGRDFGATLFFQGEIAEIIVYNSAISAANRAKVEAYLFARYGLFVNAPTISPGYGVFSSTQSVTMSADPGASIRYTTDGSTPSPTSTLYTGAISVTSSTTIKAIAIQSFGSSAVTTAFLEIDPTTSLVNRSNIALWLKANNGVTTSGSNVTQWQDMSTNANNAVQGTGANQPTFVASAANGKPAIAFNGSSQYLQLGSGFANFNTGASIFIVTKPTAAATNARFIEFGNGATSNNVYLSEPTSTGVALNVYSGSTPSSVTASSGVTLNQYQLLEAVHNGAASATLYTTGVQTAQGAINNITNVTRTANLIGTNNAATIFFQGEIAEVIVYSRAVTASERANIESYLYARYGLAVNPPTISPTLAVFTASQSVTMSADPGASIYYTVDGTTPSAASTPYSTSIHLQ